MPFTTDQFLSIFRDYNVTVFPMQIILILLACGAIALLFLENKNRHKLICADLAFLWLWIGVVYHLIFFSTINKAAYMFGVFFIIQSLFFLYWGVIKETIIFNLRRDWMGIIGWILILYSLLIYPILGSAQGHGYPYQPTFGLPCPTTIFTFGMLIFTPAKTKLYIYIIPFLWALLGFTAAFKLGILEDLGLIVSALLSVSLIFFKKKKTTRVTQVLSHKI